MARPLAGNRRAPPLRHVADSGNNTIRKVTSNGVVTTLAGSAGQPGSADGTNNTALFNFPRGVAVNSAGNLYVADAGNNRISFGTPMPTMSIKWSALGVIVSWPSLFTGLVLQQNSDLGNASGWSTTSYNISDDGLTISPPAGSQFFHSGQTDV